MKSSIINRRVILALLSAMLSVGLHAQTTDVQSRINDIYADGNYIYGEAMAADSVQAYSDAMADLLRYANELRMAEGLAEIDQTFLQGKTSMLSYHMIDKHLVFLYVTQEQALATESTPSVVEQPRDSVAPATSSNDTIVKVANGVLRRQLWRSVIEYLKQAHEHHHITEMKSAEHNSDIPTDAYVVLFDVMMQRVALFSPARDGVRINLDTDQPDSLGNYKQVARLWFR